MTVTFSSAIEQLSLLRARRISPLELAEEHIRQIQRLNPSLNAIVDFDADRVRAQAAQPLTGPLAGLPLTIKSSIATKGYRCEIGSTLHRGFVPEAESVAVARLRAAGATLLGTTNCPEFLMAYETDNLLYGRTNNPWSLDHSAGGSSGGEAAAIAAGLSACGIGSDSGGSVRQPAHFCGIASLKPTPGRVPGRGHLPSNLGPFAVLGAIGPMGRTIADVALLFEVLSGHDPADPISVPVEYKPVSIEDAKRVPIGWMEDGEHTPVTPETRQSIQDAVTALEKQGFTLHSFRSTALEEARELWWTFFMQCGAMFYAPTIHGREKELSPIFREFLELGKARPSLTADNLLQSWAQMNQVREKLLREMQQYPILLTPVCSVPAFRHGERRWMIDGQTVHYLEAMCYTQWFNLLGAPAAVVPVGRSREGLPIGVQVAGRPYHDEEVLTIAACLERDFGYSIPPIATR